MDKTANYGLNKPAGSDYADVNVLNENMDVIDLEMKKQEDFAKEHAESKKNPHSVTASQVGLGNVPNVATNDQTPTYTEASSLTELSSGEKLAVAFGKIKKAVADLISHIANKSNPHHVTAEQTGADQAGAAAAVQANLDRHTGDGSIHVTEAERSAWNGKAEKFAPVTVTVPAASWSGTGPYTQDIVVSGVTSTDSHIGIFPVDITDSDARTLYDKAYCCLAAEAETGEGIITLICRGEKPEIDFNVSVRGVK